MRTLPRTGGLASRSFLLSVLVAWAAAAILLGMDFEGPRTMASPITERHRSSARGTHARSPARARIARIAILYWGASWTC